MNWDPKGQTTISDDEIVYVEEKAKFYYFQYGPFVIGTARPETKFGDKYIVVNPNDARYSEFTHGQQIELEWINGPITATVIKDEASDPEIGTGAMTITPWHSVVDFERRIFAKQVFGFMDQWMRRVWTARQYGYSWKEIGLCLNKGEDSVKMKFKYRLSKLRSRLTT